MENDVAKAICVSSIWLSTAIIFAFGILDVKWGGVNGPALLMFVSTSVLLAASISTYKIFHPNQNDKNQ